MLKTTPFRRRREWRWCCARIRCDLVRPSGPRASRGDALLTVGFSPSLSPFLDQARISLEESLSVTPFAGENQDGLPGEYRLRSVVHHVGNTASSGTLLEHHPCCVSRTMVCLNLYPSRRLRSLHHLRQKETTIRGAGGRWQQEPKVY